MRKVGLLVAGTLCIAGALGCAKSKEAAPAPSVAVTQSSGPGEASQAITATATVEDVDVKNRLVTLRTADGELSQIKVGEEVRNLPQIRKGDIVLVRTGWIDNFMANHDRGPADVVSGGDYGQPGLAKEASSFMDKYDIVAIGCDNSAIEVLGRPGDGFLDGHVEFLVNRGIHLVEHLMLKEMADDQCYESLFIVAPLPVVGAAGSPVNPIAIG